MRKNGSITVFLTLIFIVIMSLITAVIENTRVLSSKGYISVAANSAAEMVMGEYNKELYDEYKLFGYGGYNGLGEMDINEEFMGVLNDNLAVRPQKDTYKTYSDIYRFSNVNSEIIKCMKLPEEKYLEEQISEYLKLSLVDDIKDAVSNKQQPNLKNKIDTQALEVAKDYENGKYDEKNDIEDGDENNENTNDNDSNPEENNTGGEDEPIEDSAGGNPLESLKDIVKDGVLSLVCDEINVSENNITPRKTPDENKENTNEEQETFSAGDYLKNFIDRNNMDNDEEEGLLSKSEIKTKYIIYAKKMLSSYINNLDKTVDYGMEYLAAGKESEKDNLLYVVNRFMVMRMGVNYAYILSNTALKEKALATATVIAGIVGIPAVITAVQYTILTILAYEESCIDVRALLQNRAIPMIKNSENFKMKYEEICIATKNLFKKKAMQYEKTSDNINVAEFTYEKGIMLLQMIVPVNVMKERLLDVIQQDMQKRFNQTFSIDNCICYAEYKVTYDIPYAFSYLSKSRGGNMAKREVTTLYEYKS